MGVEASPIVEERVVSWITALLGRAGALEDQRDPDWRHAYGLAQGAGFILRNRQWPQFPSTSGSSFQRLVAEERDRRGRGEGPRPIQAHDDPLAPVPAGDEEARTSPHEASAEQLIKGLVKQVQRFGPDDPAWRHAYGVAQGVGALLQSERWALYPLAQGAAFARLMNEEQAGRKSPTPRPGSRHDAPTPPSVPRPPAPPRAGPSGTFDVPASPSPPAPPSPPRSPEPPADFRALPTLLTPDALADDGDEDEVTEADARAALTMLQEAEEAAAAPAAAPPGPPLPSSAMPTFLQTDEDDSSPPPPPALGAGGLSAFERSQPTLLQVDDEEDAGPGASSSGPSAAATAIDDSGRLPRATTTPPTPVKRDPPTGAIPRDPPTGGAVHRDPPSGTIRRDPGTGSLKVPGGRRPPPSLREVVTGKAAQPQRRREEAAEAEQLDRIGKWEIVRRLGKGAMGQVFMGRGPDGTLVAIKVLHQHLGASKRVRARFMREAKAVERIQHPNVVRFVETGEQPGVGQFIAMEFVDGKPLHEVLRERQGERFPLAQAMDLMLQACRGMRAAHAAGVIHRDLKPENILLSNKGEMKITDFSLARREQDSILLTRAGQVMGTPHFMSPEQAKGQPVDVRTDVYSLGAILYVLLTGQFPFPNGTVAEVIAAHCEQPRPDPRAINPDVTEDIARICQKAMAIDRNERYPTIDALIEELHRVLGITEEREQDIEGALPPGARIDEFTVEKVLGAGGMGAVYRATSAAGETVALKVLPPQPGRDPQERLKDVRRFLNEAKLAKRVGSPNVYKVLKYGVDEGGQAYMAASLAEGTSLREWVSRNGPLKPEQLIKVARGVCQALQAIHGAEVLHRDITPANVMLPADWETKKDAGVVIIDFGLAVPLDKEKAGAAPEPTALFKHRVAKKDDDIDEEALYLDDLPGGTPAYMAPEVLEDPSDVDERADLYGLGATMYFAATGHPPYSGDGIEAVLYQQKSQPPAPITQFNADFPEELSELIIQLLAHEPHTRPRSAKLCLSKLQRIEDPRASAMSWRPDQVAVPVVEAAPPPARFQWGTFALGFVVGAAAMAAGAFAMQLF